MAALKALTQNYVALSLPRSEFAARLGEINCPTLIIWGKQDKLLPMQTAQLVKKQIANSKLYLFDCCGHMP